MNERIRELLNEATVGLEPDLSPQRTVTLNELEKFAELIVLECANMAESFHRNQFDFTGKLELHEFIKQHFGVEE